jgi:hypothetical protein
VRAALRVCHSFGKNKTVVSAAAQNVVDVALYASRSNILGVGQSSGSTALEKVRLLSRATIEGRSGTRYAEELAGAEGSARNGSRKEMIVAVAPRHARQEVELCVYMLARDTCHRGSKKACTTRVMWLTASNLTWEKIFKAPGGLAIAGP